MIATDVSKIKEQYVGREVEMFNNNWFAKIVDIDCLGWTFQITRRYSGNTNSQKNGDIIFYSHNDKLNFTFR